MKRPCIVLAILLLSLAVPSRADIRAWRADLASEEVHNEYVRRGDSATLRVAVYLRGREYRPSTAVARFRAGLDSPDWLQSPCTIASNVVEVSWTPMLAPGADVVPMIVHVDGEVYRIPLMLYVRDSPAGDEPGERPVLDLAAYSVTNAPWVVSVNGRTGTVALDARDVPVSDGMSVRDAIVYLDDSKVSKSGDTMTGELKVSPWAGISGDSMKRVVFTDHDLNLVTTLTADGTPVVTEGSAALAGKQAAILDLETIRSGASAGASAVQPSELPGLVPEYIVSPETARGTAYTGVSRDTALRDGKMILYYMQTQATAAWTLNLTLADGTTTGAKPVRFWGTTAIGTQYAAGSIIPLVYRSGAWYVSDRDTNENTYDRVRVSSYVRFSASTTKYAICCGTTDGYRKVAPGVVFDASMPILYANVNATSAAGAQSNNFYASMPGVDVRNTVSGFASRRGKPLYLVGSLAADGRTFTIGDPALTYEATPPCIPLGLFNNNADNQLHFLPGPLLSGQTGDASAVTNLVADLLADEVDALPVQSTLEVHRLVLADLWDRVDRMSGSSDADTIDDILLALDGLDARLTALEARSGVTATRMAALEASVGTTATRMAAIEASSAATPARMSALSGPSTVPAASDLQAPGTINASAVQDSAGAQ